MKKQFISLKAVEKLSDPDADAAFDTTLPEDIEVLLSEVRPYIADMIRLRLGLEPYPLKPGENRERTWKEVALMATKKWRKEGMPNVQIGGEGARVAVEKALTKLRTKRRWESVSNLRRHLQNIREK